MIIDRSILHSYLELLQKCSSSSINEDVSDKIMFHPFCISNASKGRLLTFIKCDIDFEGIFVLDTILKIVKAVSGNEINLIFTDDELKISSSKSKLGLKPITIENWQSKFITSPLKFTENKEFKPLPKTFLQALTAVKQCAAGEKNLSILSNIAIIKNNCIASDNYRIGYYKLSGKFENDFLLDVYNIDGILAFNPEEYSLCEDRIIFKRDEDIQICAINSIGKYPDFLPILNRDKSSEAIQLPEELKEAVNVVQQIPGKNDDSQIKIDLAKNKLALSYNTINGWFKRNIRIDYTGTPITFSMNINVLNDALRNVGNELLLSEEGTGMMKLENFKYVFPIELETQS